MTTTPVTPDPHPENALKRPVSVTLRRHRFLLIFLFCLLSSAVFLTAPLLNRTYHAAGTVQTEIPPNDALPDAEKISAAALNRIPHSPQNPHVTLQGQTLTLSADTATREAAIVRLHTFSEQYANALRAELIEQLRQFRQQLGDRQKQIAIDEETQAKALQTYRDSQALPADPAALDATRDKLAAQLTEKNTRLQQIDAQLAHPATAPAAVPAPAPTPAPPPPTAAAPQADPEVIALTAQLQLITNQIEEQLRTRTEQHPYVVDLRSQQVALQKRLDAARARVATVQTPPPAQTPSAPPAGDPTLAAAQQAQLRRTALEIEKTALAKDIANLTQEHDTLQKQIDAAAPLRAQWERRTAALDAIHKARADVAHQLEAFDRQFPPAALAAGSTDILEPLAKISPLNVTSYPALPRSPSLPLIYLAGTLAALAVAAALGLLLHQTDRSLHTPREAALHLDLPVLGAVSEILSPAQRRRRTLWTLARPLASLALVLALLASAFLCYRNLAASPSQARARYAGPSPFFAFRSDTP